MGRVETAASLVAAIGVVVGRVFTYTELKNNTDISRRNYEISKETLEMTKASNRESLEASLNGQYSERFTSAIPHLGNNSSMDTRIAAIYALGRLAEQSLKDEPTVTELLSAYLRQHLQEGIRKFKGERKPRLAADTRAAVNVLARFDHIPNVHLDLYHLDGHGINLSGIKFVGASMPRADFSDAVLGEAKFPHAQLQYANFDGADLSEANLGEALLSRAHFRDNADLWKTDFRKARLCKADMRGAKIWKTDFRGADLRGVQGVSKKFLLDRLSLVGGAQFSHHSVTVKECPP